MYVQLRYEILRESVNIHGALGIHIAPKVGTTGIYHCAAVSDPSYTRIASLSLGSAVVKPPFYKSSQVYQTHEAHRPPSHISRAARLRILIRLPV
jgi:hypothetical protein